MNDKLRLFFFIIFFNLYLYYIYIYIYFIYIYIYYVYIYIYIYIKNTLKVKQEICDILANNPCNMHSETKSRSVERIKK